MPTPGPDTNSRTLAEVIRAVGVLLVGVLASIPTTATAAGPGARPAQAGEPRAYIVVEPESGAILDARRPHDARPVGGAVKLMTALTALQRIPNEDRVVTTPRAADAPEPRLGMRQDTTWELEDLVQAMLLSSANDAAYALAEGAAGSLSKFAAEMTRMAELMELEDSSFTDPAGVDDDSAYEGPSRMSAYDLAVVGASVLASRDLAEIVALPDYRVVTPDGVETGLTQSTNEFLRLYPDATGIMTSSSVLAGNVVVASAERDGRTLIAVVLDAPDAIPIAADLLDRGFASDPDPGEIDEHIPAVRVTTIQTRLVALTGLPLPLGAPSVPPWGPKGPDAPVSEEAAPAPREPAADPDRGGGSGFPFLRVLALLLAAGLVVAVVWRHRRLQHARFHRRARERALAEARRRGTLDVVDEEVSVRPDEVKIVRR